MADEQHGERETVPVVPHAWGGWSLRTRRFLKRIADLKPLDEQGAREIVADVIKAGLSELAIETLIKPLAEALGVGIQLAKKFWKEAAKEARDAANAELAKLAAEAQARFNQEASERRQQAATSGMIEGGLRARRSP